MANILILSVEKRKDVAVEVQGILTEAGCMIKTRLGLHENGDRSCHDNGLIILQIEADSNDINDLIMNLEKIDGVKTRFVEI